MNGFMNGQMDGFMNVQMDGWVNEWMDNPCLNQRGWLKYRFSLTSYSLPPMSVVRPTKEALQATPVWRPMEATPSVAWLFSCSSARKCSVTRLPCWWVWMFV